MKTFFLKTHYFWVVSRIILIFLFTISIIGILAEDDLKQLDELLANVLGVIYTIALAVLSIAELSKRKAPVWLRKSTGVLSILFGFVLAYVILFVGSSKSIAIETILIFFPTWFVLFGIWDLIIT